MYGVGLWKNIRRGWEKFHSHTKFEVRDCFKVRFWHNIWCEDIAHKDAFPVLLGIACTNDAPIVVLLDFFGGAIQWNVIFIKATQDWEVDTFASFL